MLHSMTGFGQADREEGGHLYHLEIQSVNHRYLKVDVHLPEEWAFLESDVERLVRQRLARGSVVVRLRLRDQTAQAAAELNLPALREYVRQLRQAAGDQASVTIDLATLANLPGVCQPRELTDEQRGRVWAVLQGLLEQSLERLVAMRAAEGATLLADLQAHCRRIREHLGTIRQRVPTVIREYADRLAARVRELLAGGSVSLAEEDLLKEVAIYAERSDISEEISRLESHLTQFEQVAAHELAGGRKLEFIAQEMLREANTIGSKAGDTEIARAIIEIKSAIDRIKEQVQNVE